MGSAQGFNPTGDACERIAFAKLLYMADLRAMPHEVLDKKCGGKARTGYDVI